MPAETKTTLVWHLKDEVSGPARGIKGALGSLISPTGLAIAGVGALAGGLVMAAQAAAEEEVNIAKLNQALKTSIPNWDGNTEAIEETIAARENLAFTDDDLRNSMALLVTATEDVTAATDLQNVAMDLARLKGVDLATATTAVIKLTQGSTREMKALGIEVDDSATAMDNLDAVAEAAAGQAAAYAETTQGKWETLQNKFGDVVEDIGTELLPIFNTLLDFVIDEVIPGIKDLGAGIDTFVHKDLHGLWQLLGWVNDRMITFNYLLGQTANKVLAPKGTKVSSDLITYVVNRTSATGTKLPTRAAGGPVDAWGAYTVGENGPETLVMGGRSGTIIPGVGSAGGTPVELPIVIDGREVARVVDERLYLAVTTVGGGYRPR